MKYKVDFVMSKHVTREELLESKVKYLEAEVDNGLQRLHQCKRRNREDKIELRKTIESLSGARGTPWEYRKPWIDFEH